MIRALLQLLIGCFLLPLCSWLSPAPPSLLSLPALGRSARANCRARPTSAPPLSLLRRMEGAVRRKGWMRERSGAKTKGGGRRGKGRVPGSRPMNRFSFAAAAAAVVVVVVVVWPGFFCIFYFSSSLLIILKKGMGPRSRGGGKKKAIHGAGSRRQGEAEEKVKQKDRRCGRKTRGEG